MRKVANSVVAVAALLVSACHGSGNGSTPSGQVIAKVGSNEITHRELNAELNGFSSNDPNATKTAQSGALNAIVNRKLLAQAARDAGLEKSPEFQLAVQRANELMLAQAYEQQLAAKAAKPSAQEVTQYIAAHPNTFGQRKIYTVDQILIPAGTDRKVLAALKPLTSMDQIEALLLKSNVEYSRSPSTIDARNYPPTVADQIARLPADQPFVLPSQTSYSINRVTEVKTSPFTGPTAEDYAEQLIQRERAAKIIADKLAELRKKNGVQYQNGFAPGAKDEASEQAPKPVAAP